MDIEKLIKSRRAVYPIQYTGAIVPEEHIEKMLELANWAPTHKHTEPWRFLVYSGAAQDRLLDAMKEIYIRKTPADKYSHHLPQKLEERKKLLSHSIVIVMQRHPQLPEFEEIAAVSMAVQNMWLYVSSIPGLGAYWSSPSMLFTEEFARFLDLDPNQQCLGIFNLGVCEEDKKPEGHRRDWREKVKYFKI